MAMVSPQSDNAAEQEALSAYLDNQLSAAERATLERRLEMDERLRAELRELQAVKTALNELPSVAPPRSFTLDPATARGPMRLPLFQFLRLGSALATILLMLTFTLDFVSTTSNSVPMAAQAPAAGSDTAGGAAANVPTPAPFMSAARKQPTAFSPAQAQDASGGQPNASSLQQESSATAAAAGASSAAEVGAPAATSAPAAAEAPAATSAPAAAEAPAATSAPVAAAEAEAPSAPAAMSAPAVGNAPTTLPEVVQPGPLHASGSSSPGTDSSALPVPQQRSGAEQAPTNIPLRWLQLALGVIAAALALGAWLVWRR